ncbi:hypothetical protein BW014_20550 [Salmonella enterica]|nr:hypothetical protein [Salmonella enterica subsp. enterica serovar Oranienburg]EBG9726400.1 hypothetical protein [Salmonella enterica]EBW2599195.1 hypothetical protein [Salmonella enterica subsp. enterica serovar Poano]EDU8203255.1 hypothetical protein [Salmonella enterica subsp. diarizonae]ECT8479735.1 hypothetical protein [Salmonella enterica]
MDRNTARNDGKLFAVPMAAGEVIGGGLLVVIDEQGLAHEGQIKAGWHVIGLSDEAADNSAGQGGEVSVMVRRCEAFYFDNDTANPVTQVAVGKACWLKNAYTVTASAPAEGSIIVGRVLTVSPDDGVQVLIE